MVRRVFLVIAGLLIGTLFLLVMTPWWLGVAVRSVAPRFGVSYDRYERLGYSRFALQKVEMRRGNVLVRIDRVEADSPVVWTWRHLRRRPTRVVATTWSVEVSKRNTPPPPSPSGWMPLRGRLLRIAAGLDRWLPRASAGAGEVKWPTGQLRIESAHWDNGSLAVRGLRYSAIEVDGTVQFESASNTIAVETVDRAEGMRASLKSVGATVSGVVAWQDQTAAVETRYGQQGWLPDSARVVAKEIRIPGDRLKVGNVYGVITGRIEMQWNAERFGANVVLHGDPLAGVSSPPLDLVARAEGDQQSITVHELHATAPGLVADLDAPVTFDRLGGMKEASARFSLRCDLAQQPWIPGHGILTSQIQVHRQPQQRPTADFEISADGVDVEGFTVSRLKAGGQLQWPRLDISAFELVGREGEALRGSGSWDFAAKTLGPTKVAGSVKAASIARFVPASVRFSEIRGEAEAGGRLRELHHRGHVTVTGAVVGRLRTADLDVDWNGEGLGLRAFDAEARFGEAALRAKGSADSESLRLTELSFSRGKEMFLQLTKPMLVAFRPALRVEGVSLEGTDAYLRGSLAWGPQGNAQLAVSGLRSEWIDAVVPLRGPRWTVRSLAVTAAWDHGPANFEVAGQLSVNLPSRGEAAVGIAGRGDRSGIVIEGLRAIENGNPVASASGHVPVVIAPGQSPLVEIDPEGALTLEASAIPNADFWQQLTDVTGVELRAPTLEARIKGTWARPQGVLTFRAEGASMDPKRFVRPLPAVESVQVTVRAEGEGITLEQFDFRVEGQPVKASGSLLIRKDGWAELLRAPQAYVQQGVKLRLEIPDADVGKFSRFLPAALAPAGRLQVDVSLDRGKLGGFLRLRHAASRPLGPLGVLQDLSADVEFTDHQVNLRQVTATAGGQPIRLSGTVELPRGGLKEPLSDPQYDVTLTGQNLPFVRQAGLLVRGDLDLKLRSPAKGPPSISGQVVLRDSLFLTDVRSFIPHGSGVSPSRRPPYFSVEMRPLNSWPLSIDVSGTRFMRLRTPVFAGVASTRFHLGGTLGEPRAVGEATIDDGQILMPFASFAVKQGSVRLTEEDPYEPTVFLRGTGRHYGYDLTMEVSGDAASPNITFTSSPALDSEQVLLMVMTGAAPSNEVNTSLTQRAVQIGAFFGQSLYGSLVGSDGSPDRLSIESGAKISRQGRETYAMEYKLTDRLSVTGEYDEFDEYNAGLKWRLTPRKLER